MKNFKKGFTLIELMIVVAIIAIIAAIAIPGLLRARIASNEGSAIGTLRSIGTGEDQYRTSIAEDNDANGVGEYGNLRELAEGEFIARGLRPTLDTDGFSIKSGYRIQIFPGDDAAASVNDTRGIAADANGANDSNESAFFIVYAWPDSLQNTGVRAFVLDHSNEIAFNLDEQYSGTTPAPAADDARDSTATTAKLAIGAGVVATGGGTWQPIK